MCLLLVLAILFDIIDVQYSLNIVLQRNIHFTWFTLPIVALATSYVPQLYRECLEMKALCSAKSSVVTSHELRPTPITPPNRVRIRQSAVRTQQSLITAVT
jgi:hypothetical protein